MIVITEYYTATEYGPVQRRRRRLADRTCHQHHRRPRRQHEVDGAAGDRGVPGDLGRLHARRTVRHRRCRHRHAVDDRHDRGARCLRPDHRQRRRHRRDGRARRRRCATSPIRSMRSATPPRRSPRATRSARRDWPRWCCLPTTPTTCARASRHTLRQFSLSDPAVIIGLFIGGLVPYLFGCDGDGGRRSRRRLGGHRGAPAVPRDQGHHGGHGQARLLASRGPADARGDPAR